MESWKGKGGKGKGGPATALEITVGSQVCLSTAPLYQVSINSFLILPWSQGCRSGSALFFKAGSGSAINSKFTRSEIESWWLKTEPSRLVADFYHLDEEQDPDLHQSDRWIRIRIKVNTWIRMDPR
jgi:hypothetical protein